MGHLYSNILETIGNTPVVKINNLGPQNVNISRLLHKSMRQTGGTKIPFVRNKSSLNTTIIIPNLPI